MKYTFTFAFLLVLLAFFELQLNAQDYLMSNDDISDCSGFFLDSGGNGSYGADEDLETTICADGVAGSGTHVQLVFSGSEFADGDIICFYDGEDTAAPLLACNTDFLDGTFIIQATAVNTSGCVTVTFSSDGIDEASGWEADMNCEAACQQIIASISMSDPEIMPADTGYIDICPGDRVFLTGMGTYPQNGEVYEHSDLTSSFAWDFGDGIQGVGPNVVHTFDEPGGYVMQLKITDVEGCENNNFISQRVRVSPYPVFEEGAALPAEICFGDTVNIRSDISATDTTFNVSATAGTGGFQTEQTRSDSLALPDGTGASYETSVSFTDFSPGQVLTNVEDIVGICVNMEHSWLRDLEIRLRCPDGTEVILHDHPGAFGGEVFLGEPNESDSGANPIPGVGYDYCWTENAPNPTWIDYCNTSAVGTLPVADYSPYNSLSAFLGCPLNGEWTIIVTDLWGGDNGYIFSWGIEFAQDLYPTIETFSPVFEEWGWQDNPSIFFNTPDSISAMPNAGTASYTFETLNSFGCAFDTTFQLTVLPKTHPDCYECQQQLTPAADTIICVGETVAFNVSGEAVNQDSVTFETVPNYPLGNPNHPPANAYFSEIAINSVSPAQIIDPTVDIISVCVDFETNWNSDIQMILVTPDGEQLELSTNNGGSGDNYENTCFTPTATTDITAGTSPFLGNYQPEGDWNDLIGENSNGIWALKISDAGGQQMGMLRSWSITFNAENDVQYVWTPPVDLSCILCPDPTAAPAATVDYTVTSVDSYGCAAEDDVRVEVVDEIPAPVVDCDTDVDSGTFFLEWDTVNGITEYEINLGGGWMPISGTEFSQSGFDIGDVIDYEIRAVFPDGNCGTATLNSSCEMLFDCDFVISSGDGTSMGNVDCDGSCDAVVSVSVMDAMQPVVYTILNNDTGEMSTQGFGQFTGLCPGAYTFSATDGNDCTSSFDYLVVAPDPIMTTATDINNVSCNGGNDGSATVSATGGNGDFTYEWNDPLAQTGPTATLLTAGSYTVTATDVVGCEEFFQIVITEPTELTTTTAVSNVSCTGDNTGSIVITPAGGTAPYTIAWQDVPDGNNLFAGIYTATVTDVNSCETIVTETIDEPAEPLTVELTQTFISCFETDESSALAVPSGGTGDYTYAWDNGDNTAEATNLTFGDHNVTVTDENNCQVVQTISVTQLEELIPNISVAPTSCSGANDGNAVVNFTEGGVGTPLDMLQYAWSNGSDMITASNLSGGEIIVTITDAQGCVGMASNTITTPETIEIETAFTLPLCAGEATGTASVANVINGSGDVEYLWDAAAGNQTTATATNLEAGTYSVTATDGGNCTAEATITVTEPEALSLEFATTDNDCFGEFAGTATATAAGGTGSLTYLWENGETGSTIENLFVGTYEVTVVDANDCRLIDSTTILQPGPLEADILTEDVNCFGNRNGSVTAVPLGGTAPFRYSLNGENFNGSSTQIGLTAGDYTIFIEDANECVNTFEFRIEEPDALELFVETETGETLLDGDETLLILGDSIELQGMTDNAQGATVYTWQEPYFGTLNWFNEADSSIVRSNTQNTLFYKLAVVDEAGCTDDLQIRVRVIKERVVLVPTGFSPNGNSQNRTLRVHGKEGTTIDVFRVYDRWGELMYETSEFPVNSNAVGWDGTFRGKEMPAGVYVWYLEARYIDGNTETFKGNSTLVR